ncbi:MAG: hydrogenase maturation protease [Bacteroidota bacterium]
MKGADKVLILGVGNYLMGDEGVGVHAARYLENEVDPLTTEVLDGGTAGFQLMEYFEQFPTVILIDATLDDRPPGTIRLIEPRFAADFPHAMSTHEIGLKDLVESLTLLDRLPKIYLFVVSVQVIQPLSMELTKEVKSAIPKLTFEINKLLKSLVNVDISHREINILV